MAGMIAKQPNGLYCRYSSVVDTITHYNFTEEEYLNNITGTVHNREEGIDVLENYLHPFEEVEELLRLRLSDSESEEEVEELISNMYKERKEGYMKR
ncbi:hypothetical protein G6Z25_02395 [Clostridium perfringens]|uniref:hypothetical protein n=1 Tax=Clostridium perfringens TaxID=1502 RepID=UPI0013E2D1A6|nr:hypothetical protein [Clostridium perfringens]NGS95770.1 hypothetical protein [Clostridium perfringens]